jgi:pyruvate/2-oxoglutarate dehydrogenase complex dihydrolipoamide dehydrogenase (E3) component
MGDGADTYDVIVIGGGPAGENAADRAARGGLSVALVEAELLGGECSYWACMPSKALLRPAEALAATRRVPGAREAITRDLDVAAVLARRDQLASGWDDAGQVVWAEGAGLEVLRGRGRLAGERVVELETGDGEVRTLRARRAVVLATGSRPLVPPVDGLVDAGYWTSREITTAERAPRRLLVLGGGVVGVEMAQAWRTLGSDVTLVELADRLLPAEEPFAGEQLAEALAGLGVDVRTGVKLDAVRRDGAAVLATLSDGDVVEADELVVATGRRGAVDGLGLETVGVEPGGFVEVDEHLRVRGVPGGWLYAVGDVNGRAPLTHTGKYQARLAGDEIAGSADPATGDLLTPRVVFTDPQVAAVGLTEAQAREQGIAVRAVRYELGDLAAAATLGQRVGGTAQIVVDQERQVLVGATFTGPGVGELLHAATIAIVGEVPLPTLWHAIPAFPTLSEVWLRLLEAYGL